MKFLAGAALAATVFAAAGFAYSAARPTPVRTVNAVTPAQFNALKARVAKLEKSTAALVGYTVNCLVNYVGVARFGSPPSNGYVFDTDNNPANGQSLASALDLTDAGEAPSVYVPATTNTGCLSSGAAVRRELGVIRAGLISSRALGQEPNVASAPYGSR